MAKGKKDRQHNGQRKNDKETNNYLQNTTKKTKDRSTWEVTSLIEVGYFSYRGDLSYRGGVPLL